MGFRDRSISLYIIVASSAFMRTRNVDFRLLITDEV